MLKRALAALAMLCWTGAIRAEPLPVKTADGKTWKHKDSHLSFPPAIGSFMRHEIVDLSDGRNIDVSASYREPATGTLATVYIYRPAMPLAPLWFDIANWFIQHNQHFAPLTTQGGATSFVVGGQTQTASLRQVYATGPAANSTGIAIIPLGRWIVKIRMSSPAYKPRMLDTTLETFARGLGWPQKLPAADGAMPIGICRSKLAVTQASEIKQAPAEILVGAALGSTNEDRIDKGEFPKPPRICRDDSRADNAYPIYQLEDGVEGYLIAIGDSGTLLVVRNDTLSGALHKELGTDKSQAGSVFFRITLMTPLDWKQYAAFGQLPPVEQAFDLVNTRAPLSVTDLLGKRGITLDAGSFK